MNKTTDDGADIRFHHEELKRELAEIDKRFPVTERETKLLAALKGLMDLIHTGVLVRDTSKDGEAGWAIRQIPLVQCLAVAASVIEECETWPQFEQDNDGEWVARAACGHIGNPEEMSEDGLLCVNCAQPERASATEEQIVIIEMRDALRDADAIVAEIERNSETLNDLFRKAGMPHVWPSVGMEAKAKRIRAAITRCEEGK